jgi:hypothetical protein
MSGKRRKHGYVDSTNRPQCASTGCGCDAPWLKASAEVGLLPRGQDDLAIHLVEVREGKRERRRAADNLASGGVLRAVARANVLELSAVPWDDAAEVSA